MELSKKVKIALDETRMLILGAQILLGFQFRGPFSDGFDQLPTGARYLAGLALGFMRQRPRSPRRPSARASR